MITMYMKGFTTRRILFLFLLFAQEICAQQSGEVPSETLTEIGTEGKCTAYSFNYPSTGVHGEPLVLSAALFAWTPDDRMETDSIETLHIYSHITITSDNERPSTSVFAEESGLLMLLPGRQYGTDATGGVADYAGRCIIIAPDYEGYGLTKDIPHPYLMQRLTAQQVIDGVRYGLKLYEKTVTEGTIDLLPLKSDWRSFGLGYSQGGSVSLAVHRHIEENGLEDELRFQGSICGDGPYDLISTIRFYLEDNGTSYGKETPHRKGLVSYPVVIPLIAKSMCESHPAMAPYKYEDFLSQQMLDTGVLDWLDSKSYTTDQISEMWYKQLQEGLDAGGRHYTPEQMAELFESPSEDKVWAKAEKVFTKEVYEYFSDPSNFNKVPETPANAPQALHRAMADNTVATGWDPKHRIQFFHSKGDIIVPYGNYLVFQGAHPLDHQVYRINDTFSEGDHVDAGTTFLLNLLAAKTFGNVFNWIGGTPTGVAESGELNVESESNVWYMLSGHRLSGKPVKKGLYINGGKKVLVQ